MNKEAKTLSELVANILYENCCNGKLCNNCKYDTAKFDCHISNILKLIRDYEKENEIL